MLQSIVFDKESFTLRRAKAWLHKHHLIPIKDVHHTVNSYRFRMSPPKRARRYYSKYVDDGVLFIFD
jgi:hypothetical protein